MSSGTAAARAARRLAALSAKESLLLARDRAGLLVLFVMPMALVFVVTVIQDATFRSVNETRVPVLLLDLDRGAVGEALRADLARTGFFTVHAAEEAREGGEAAARAAVAAGRYLLAVVVPEGTTDRLRENAAKRYAALRGMGPALSGDQPVPTVRLYFDPVTKQSFKATVGYAVRGVVGALEMRTALEALAPAGPGAGAVPDAALAPLVAIEERYAVAGGSPLVPNSVQHNVPAWTMFAMFFITLPLSGGMIRERHDGTGLRLRVMPVSRLEALLGKAAVYLAVCAAQALLLLAAGRFLLPLLGLPALQIAGGPTALAVITLSAGLAAVGYGIAVGAMAETQEQAASFGAVSVVILAAVGGAFVPVFVMPPAMRRVAVLSPLNWGMEGYAEVFLRGGGLAQVAPDAARLALFGAAMILLSVLVRRLKDAR